MIPHPIRAALALLIALSSLSGCAHKQAIDQANAYAQRGDWRSAYAECERALEIDPDSEQAQACAADTRPKATAQAMEDARDELEARNYARAIDHLDYVDSLYDEPYGEAEQLRADIRSAVEGRLVGYIDNEEMEKAYEFVGTAEGLYSDAEFVADAYVTCREYFRQRSATFEQEQDFAAAVDALETIKTYEPERAAEVESDQQRLESEWARMLEDRAERFDEEGKSAGAAVLYAKAFELAGHERARLQLRRLTDELAQTTRFGIRWKIDGPRDWRRSFGRTLSEQLGNGIERVEESAQMELEFDLTSTSCDDEATGSRKATTEYVSGTRKVTNPEWEDTREELENVRRALGNAEQAESELGRDARRTTQSVTDYTRDVHAPKRLALENARQDAKNESAVVDALRKQIDDIESTVRRLERDAEGNRSKIDGYESALTDLRAEVETRQQKLDGIQREVRRHEREFADIEAELAERTSERDRLFDEYEDAQRETQRLENEVASLESELRRTPRTIEEDVIDTFEYEVVQWKRTCTAEVDVGVRVVDLDKDYETSIEGNASTSDSNHEAYPRYGVERDPLDFPTDDVALLEQVDRDLAESAYETVSESARAYWNRRVSEAVAAMSDEPHVAADVLLSVYLTAPDHLDSGEVRALEEHLVEQYEYAPMATVTQRSGD